MQHTSLWQSQHFGGLALRPLGNDIMGPFPPAVHQKKWMIVAVEYFTKWVEAEALTDISADTARKFI